MTDLCYSVIFILTHVTMYTKTLLLISICDLSLNEVKRRIYIIQEKKTLLFSSFAILVLIDLSLCAQRFMLAHI